MKYSTRNKNSLSRNQSKIKWIFYAICASTLIVCLLLMLELTNATNFFDDSQPTTETETTTTSENVDTKPPVGSTKKEEQSEQVVSGNPKDDSSQTNTPNQTNVTSTKKSVTPVITFASNNPGDSRVFGYVNGVVESTGTCTFTFTGNGTVTKKSTGVEDVSKTNCSTTPPNGDGWSVVLSYDSKAASGKSQKIVVN